uniref:Uncharacterized protein n=1 Tax=Tanacetum cinerariifolium TaxID=118510 RepID=A0A699L247_TANCI|nr:hypothetical protein [Tanacetum cinerariifolium]
MYKAFPLLVRKFPLPERTSHCLKKNATARRKVMPQPKDYTAVIIKKKRSVKDDDFLKISAPCPALYSSSNRVESYQKKLNLTKPDTYCFDLKRKEAYTAYSNPRGFIYHNKDKQNRFMRIDELYKFSDGTLNVVRTALDDRLKGIRMKYLPQAIWRKSDKERAPAIIQAIDKQLKTRIIMRSLEKFVGGRLYEGDFRMLQWTI